MDYQLISHLG
jgi:uncharacterized membrane protein